MCVEDNLGEGDDMPPESLFDRIVSLDNLRNAWIKAKHYARTEEVYFDAYAYGAIEDHLEASLLALHQELRDGSYTPAPLRYITIPKGEKERRIYFAAPRDSVVIQAVINVIGPIFEAHFSGQSYGYRLSFGDQENRSPFRRWQDQYGRFAAFVEGFLDQGPDAWYLVTDIQAFYPSVHRDWLRGLLAARVGDALTLSVVDAFLCIMALNLSEDLEEIPGLPPGPSYAHFFANVYLDEFDKLAHKYAEGYARYVDDVCLVFRDKASLVHAEAELGRHLAPLGLNFKPQKTIRRSVRDWEFLLEFTRNMRYAERLDFVDRLDIQQQQIEIAREAENLFRELFLIVETDGDLARLVENAGYVISRLRELKVPDLDGIIYSLLEIQPLKPSTMRVALSCLLEIELPELGERFRQYLLVDDQNRPYVRTNLLQVLSRTPQDVGNLKNMLMEEFSRDQSYLVRTNTYVVLRVLAEHGHIKLSLDELHQLRQQETSEYALARLIDCYSQVESEAVWFTLVSFLDTDHPRLASAVVRAIERLLAGDRISSTALESILPRLEQMEDTTTDEHVRLLYLTALYSGTWMVSRVLERARTQLGRSLAGGLFSVVALDVVDILARTTQLGRLYQFADFIVSDGLEAEAALGFEEVAAPADSAELRDQAASRRDAIRRASSTAGLPDWYDPVACKQSLYRETRGDPEYQCFEFYCQREETAGTLELCSLDRIRQGGFETFEEWVEYLCRLDSQEYISLVDAGFYNDGDQERAFCIYSKPQGFATLTDWLEHSNAEGLLPPQVTVDIGVALARAIAATDRGDFHLRSIDPLNILWNPIGELRFMNIGASLGIPAYECGIDGCPVPSIRDEIGPTAAAYHLGLLLLQLLRRDCPLEAVSSTQVRYSEHPKLIDLTDVPGTPPHFRLILMRMLQKVPEYRYSSFELLAEDLERVADYFRISDQLTPWHTISHFVVFRLGIITRNPEFLQLSPVFRNESMLASLSSSLKYLPVETLGQWRADIQARPPRLAFPSRRRTRSLSPEGRRLVAVAEGWESGVATSMPSQGQPRTLTRICLYHVLAIEASACVVATVKLAASTSQQVLRQVMHLVSDLMDELSGSQSADVSLHLLGRPATAVDIELRAEDLQQILRLLSWASGEFRLPRVGVPSLRVAGLLLTLLACACEVRRQGELVCRSIPVVQTDAACRHGRTLWQLLKDLPDFDDEIFDLDHEGHENEVWDRLPEALSIIREINRARRRPARIYSYKHLVGEGMVKLTFPRSQEIPFSKHTQYVSGFLQKGSDGKRPVKADILGSSEVLSALLAPSEHFQTLPLQERRISPARIAAWMRQHRTQTATILTGLGLGLPTVIIWSLSAITGNDPSPWAMGIASAVGGVSTNLLSGSIEDWLATRFPEDATILSKYASTGS